MCQLHQEQDTIKCDEKAIILQVTGRSQRTEIFILEQNNNRKKHSIILIEVLWCHVNEMMPSMTVTGCLRSPVVYLFVLLVLGIQADYPIGTLQCYSYLTKPGEKLICPASRFVTVWWGNHVIWWRWWWFRNNYCVKEVTSLKQDLCGKTQYFGDQYVRSLCQYKKCAAECEEGEYLFEYGGNVYTRHRYCCNDKDFCNAAASSAPISWRLSAMAVAIVIALILLIT